MSNAFKKREQRLVQIMDQAFADSARRSGDWLKCKPGCTQCCIGVFAISQLDALRLRDGMERLTKSDGGRANRVQQRAREAVERLAPSLPGDPATGILYDDAASRAAFEDFGNDEPCPALDPETGLCDLYDSRPMTCRVFGPPVRSGADDQLGICELCFDCATSEEIARCEMDTGAAQRLERILEPQAEKATGSRGQTIVAFCLK